MLTLSQFKARADEQTLIQVTDEAALAVDDVKCQTALDDAWNEILGYLFRLSDERRPAESLLTPHHYDITMYRLVGNRHGAEFESFAARYVASVKFLDGLKSPLDQADAGVSASANPVTTLLDDASMSEFGNLGVPE